MYSEPIPEVKIIWGRCGPQPPGFRPGTEVLCDKCKEEGNKKGCATLIPYAKYMSVVDSGPDYDFTEIDIEDGTGPSLK